MMIITEKKRNFDYKCVASVWVKEEVNPHTNGKITLDGKGGESDEVAWVKEGKKLGRVHKCAHCGEEFCPLLWGGEDVFTHLAGHNITSPRSKSEWKRAKSN